MKKGQHKSTICVGKALGKAGIPKRMTMRSIGNPKVGGLI